MLRAAFYSLSLSIFPSLYLVPQQRKLTGSSAQKRSGVHWCRRRVRSNEIPDKVPGFWRRFRRRCGRLWCKAKFRNLFRRRFRRRCGKLWCRARLGSTGFRRRFRRRSGRLWCKARSGSTGFWSSGEGVGSFGAEPG